MTDFATLGLGVDSTDVTKAAPELDKLAAASGRAGKAADGFKQEWVKASSEAGKARIAALMAGDAVDKNAASLNRGTAAVGAHKAGMQQLSYQLNDVATMFAMGAQPAQIFASQIGQVAGAVQLMGGSLGTVGRFLGGPWGMVITTAAVVLSPFIAKLFDTADAADEAAKSVYGLKNALKDIAGGSPMEAFGNLSAKVQTATAKLRQAQAMPGYTGGGSKEFIAGTFAEKQKAQAIAAAQLEVQTAKSEFAVANLVNRNRQLSETNEGVAKSSGRAAGGISRVGGAARTAKAQVEELTPAMLRLQDAMNTNGQSMTVVDFLRGDIPLDLVNPNTQKEIDAFGLKMLEAVKGNVSQGVTAGLDLSGVFSLIGGKNTAKLQTLAGIKINDTQTLGDKIESIFKENGAFGKTMGKLLEGSATGVAIGSMAFSQGNKGAQIGSAIGGALGNMLGPVGGIVGSLIGGIIGGVFKKTKSGSATIGAGDFGLAVTGTSGNNASRKSAASGMAGDLIGALGGIADQLGGTLTGAGSGSIGIRKKNYVYDPTGQGRTKGSGVINFGQDQEAAIKAALTDLIADGAIAGLSAGVKKLLANGDIERQMTKALKFQGVLDSVRESADPLGFAIDKIGREIGSLVTIFDEAGAAASDYAALQQYATTKLQEAALDSLRDKRGLEIKLLEMLGRDTDALAASREMELLGLKETLRPMQEMIYRLQDAQAVIDQFSPLADDLRAFKDELLGGGGNKSLAFVTAQFRTTAALAAGGDATALGKLRGVAGDYLTAATDNAATAFDARRARSQVLAAVDQGIFAAETKVDYAQLQIDAINANADILLSIKEQVSVQQTAIAENTSNMARILSRLEADTLQTGTSASDPIFVSVV